MQGLVANRIASEFVSLIYSEYDEYSDGSAVVTNETVNCRASVGALQAKDIERLEKGGIIIRNGITIVIPETADTQPDIVIYDNQSYRVVEWALKKEGDNNTIIATCDQIPIAGVE
ncbi:MAG: hypothetical protein JXN64_06320 [Spirochaetes bacterium]|nr:hypothetical protein [Spirochaetota bacterium]